MLGNFSPARVYKTLRILLTVFALALHKKQALFVPPLPPETLKRFILEQGVCFIKFAQVLATRADFFGPGYLDQLRTIHDEVQPMCERDFRIMFRRAFGTHPPFASFDDQPIASASIGQVHKAVLRDGTVVAVKLRRLDIRRKVRADLLILRFFLTLFKPLFSRYTKHSLEALIAEFAHMIDRETDMLIERDNLRRFHSLYPDQGIRFPECHDAFCSVDALVMSFEQGERIDNKEALRRLDIPFKKILDTLVAFYCEQMLITGVFHADPHPGNIMVRPDGGLTFLDFGMVKRLPQHMRVAMIEVVKAAHDRDFEKYVIACKRLGIVTPDAPDEMLQEFAERMFDIFGNENLTAASMQALAMDVLGSMRSLPFKLPQDMVYVMRVSALIEGLGTTYVENFNGVKDILPVLLKNLHRGLSGQESILGALHQEIKTLPLTLAKLKKVLNELASDSLKVRLAEETMDLAADRLCRILRPVAQAGLLVAAAFLAPLLDLPHARELGLGLFALAALRVLLGLR